MAGRLNELKYLLIVEFRLVFHPFTASFNIMFKSEFNSTHYCSSNNSMIKRKFFWSISSLCIKVLEFRKVTCFFKLLATDAPEHLFSWASYHRNRLYVSPGCRFVQFTTSFKKIKKTKISTVSAVWRNKL